MLKFIIISMIVIFPVDLFSAKWIVPQEESEKLNIRMFDSDMFLEGEIIYENACMSCHGTPTKNDFMMMSPKPGDPASEVFQKNSDGDLFYKIKEGRASMPGFGKVYSDYEIWSLVAYFRKFNKNYKQQLPDLSGIYIPEFSVDLGYDSNIDNIMVKVTDKGNDVEGATVKAYVKAMFGNHLIGSAKTEPNGLAYIQFDPNLPGNTEGDLDIIIKTTKGYGYLKVEDTMKIGKPFVAQESSGLNHLWTDNPVILVLFRIAYFGVVASIWAVIFYVVFSLKKLRN